MKHAPCHSMILVLLSVSSTKSFRKGSAYPDKTMRWCVILLLYIWKKLDFVAVAEVKHGLSSRKDPSVPSRQFGRASQVLALYPADRQFRFYVDLYCGTPPQRRTILVSTGAHEISFPCSSCEHCVNHTLFQEAQSLTYHQTDCDSCVVGTCHKGSSGVCHTGIQYRTAGSWTGVEASDVCYLGGLHDRPVAPAGSSTTPHDSTTPEDPRRAPQLAFRLNFACQSSLEGVFESDGADGTLSLNRSPQSFVSQMHRAGKIPSPTFALCLHPTTGGVLSLGEAEERLNDSRMVFSPLDPSTGGYEYVVRLRKIHLLESADPMEKRMIQTVTVPDTNQQNNLVIESAYTTTHFTSVLREPFLAAWSKMTANDFEQPQSYMTEAEIQKLPTILLQIEGLATMNKALPGHDESQVLAGELDPDHPQDVLVTIPPEQYLRYDSAQNSFVPTIVLEKRRFGRSIIGATALTGYNIAFGEGRIGWASSRCDYTYLLTHADERSRYDSRLDPSSDRSDGEKMCTLVCQGSNKLIAILIIAVACVSGCQYGCSTKLMKGNTHSNEFEGFELSENRSMIELHEASALADGESCRTAAEYDS